jgi:ketol-acid reductoisomerase
MHRMKALEKAESESQIEKVGAEIRALFESK